MEKFFIAVILLFFLFSCTKKEKFDFWKFANNEDLKAALIKETPPESSEIEVEKFLLNNIDFLDNSKILKDSKNNKDFITLILAKENYLKVIFKKNSRLASEVIIYEFDSTKKLSEIKVE